jgi:hypothetical protein
MFDLDSAVKNWRRQIEAKWLGDKRSLDELEDHLYEEVATLTRAGRSQQDAWTVAIANLGDPAELRREFAKIDRLPTFDRWTFAVLLSTAAALSVVAFVAIFVMRGQAMRGQPVLTIHIITITFGYLAGLFAALIASYATMRSFFSGARIPTLTDFSLRIVRRASIVAVVLTVLGFAFGAVWANRVLGRTFLTDAREIGAIIVAVSFLAAALATKLRSMSPAVPLAIAIAAGGAVFAAWFGVAAHSESFPTLLTAMTATGLAVTIGLAAIALKVQDNSVPD